VRVWLSNDLSTGFALWFEVNGGVVGVAMDGEVHAIYDLRSEIVVDALEHSRASGTWVEL
jgi:hypothetical protein